MPIFYTHMTLTYLQLLKTHWNKIFSFGLELSSLVNYFTTLPEMQTEVNPRNTSLVNTAGNTVMPWLSATLE